MITAKLSPCPICGGPVCIKQQGYSQDWAVVCDKCRLVLIQPPGPNRGPRLFEKLTNLAKKWNSMKKGGEQS